MRFITLTLFFVFLMSPFVAVAQGDEKKYSLEERAIIYAAQIDAYNVYCEKESALADGFLERFRDKDNFSEEQGAALLMLRDKNKNDTIGNLSLQNKKCNDLELMLAKLEIMRALKDISYLLNGVAEEDIPKTNIPALETLLPPTTQPFMMP